MRSRLAAGASQVGRPDRPTRAGDDPLPDVTMRALVQRGVRASGQSHATPWHESLAARACCEHDGDRSRVSACALARPPAPERAASPPRRNAPQSSVPAVAAVAGDPADVGRWGAPFSIPLTAVHAAMLPTGKVLWFAYPKNPNERHGRRRPRLSEHRAGGGDGSGDRPEHARGPRSSAGGVCD